MSAEDRPGIRMQNPGDLRVPPGVILEPTAIVVIHPPGEELPKEDGIKHVHLQGPIFTEEDEAAAVEATTRR